MSQEEDDRFSIILSQKLCNDTITNVPSLNHHEIFKPNSENTSEASTRPLTEKAKILTSPILINIIGIEDTDRFVCRQRDSNKILNIFDESIMYNPQIEDMETTETAENPEPKKNSNHNENSNKETTNDKETTKEINKKIIVQ